MSLTLTISATIASIAFAVSSVAYLGSGCACLFGNEEEEEDDDNNTNNRKPLVTKTNESESYQSQNNTTIGNQKGTNSETTQRSKQQTSRSAPTTRSTTSTINRVNETSLLEKAVAQNALQNQQRGPSYKSPPVLMSKRSASGKQQTLFCACGAPSSANVVKLLPCGCRTLCMPCAQEAENCPLCGENVEDSEPSFKTQRRV